MTWQDDPDWERFTDRLKPIEHAIPDSIPPWRLAALGALQVVALIGSAVVALPVITLLATALEGNLGLAARPYALGAGVLVWSLLSLSALAVLARLGSRGHLTLLTGDWVLAVLLYIALAAWVVGLGMWQVEKFGQIELDAVSRMARAWPAAAVAASLGLAAMSVSGRRLRNVLWFGAATMLLLLAGKTGLSIVAAVRDGVVSGSGAAVGLAAAGQLLILSSWLALRMPRRRAKR